jgi:hypothetical protein
VPGRIEPQTPFSTRAAAHRRTYPFAGLPARRHRHLAAAAERNSALDERIVGDIQIRVFASGGSTLLARPFLKAYGYIGNHAQP